MQSPIKLVTETALPLTSSENLLSIEYPLEQSYQGEFVGHIPAHGNFKLESSNPPLIQFRGRKFKLDFVHIHHCSEHLVDTDDPSDYEVHFLHTPVAGTLDDPKVVIGILYRISDTLPSKHGLDEFSKGLLTRKNLKLMGKSTKSPSHQITPGKFFPVLPGGETVDMQNWFHYEGSLTSYPYSEDVNWFVMKKEAIVSSNYTTELNEYAEQHPRGLQPLSRRLVVRSFS
ncbi:MAG TPA: hypothetical protein DCM07_29480 [Planctomycetaceae bacterium]|uniref:carbonic anhydrase family protein n=1 Tax=Gimesia sp. TaxID=2024833 RepID=UPI000C683FAA|nr:carbonic anhydrase family protein [Gimesia sp.]MAX35795.1 hypothetical protein [Gimesia sp.]HAH48899.1 hypothetical protein [Planctomycetaceae bacterium]|tara:strand:+ start:917 stop:1603 length:687 start_codon:yes stop_codon:yes gene_type:complete